MDEGTGLGLGYLVAASLVLTRYLATLLFEVAPADPATSVAVAVLLASVALAATAIPARRAVSASRSGEIAAGCPVAISRSATAPASRFHAASANAMISAKLPKVAMKTPE